MHRCVRSGGQHVHGGQFRIAGPLALLAGGFSWACSRAQGGRGRGTGKNTLAASHWHKRQRLAGDGFLSLLTLRFHSSPEVKMMHCTDPPRVSCGIKPPAHTHRLWGPQRPPSWSCLTQLLRGEWTWVGGVCGSAPSRPGGRTQDMEHFHHRHGPPSAAVTPPPPTPALLSPLHPSDHHLGTSYTWNPLVCAL